MGKSQKASGEDRKNKSLSPQTADRQKQDLFTKVWDLQNELRGGLDGWEFKNYILGFLFYRFISEDFERYIDEQNGIEKEVDLADGRRYRNLSDADVEEWKNDLVEEKGFFIYPSQLFSNIVKNAQQNPDLNEELAQVFKDIEASSIGTSSEGDFKDLFVDLDINSSKLGQSPEDKNKKLSNIIVKISELDFSFSDSLIDLLGDTYEFLIGQYASSAGKAGGEFFTPQEVSTLLAKITISERGKTEDLKVYDPTCGSGSLLLKFAREVGKENIESFYGQELNPTTYNLARMNMFLHGISYHNFNIQNGDTLISPKHIDLGPFDCIVANPPYSIKWEGSDNPLLINDERFAPAGVLAPKSKADLAFILHSLYLMANDGAAAIVEFPGVLYRGGAEMKIRKYLIDNNFIDAVIQLPAGLFFGTSIATCIIVLRKNKKESKTLFIDASEEFIKETNQNRLLSEHIEKIIKSVNEKKDVEYFTSYVDNKKISENDYSLSVSEYVEVKNDEEEIDIDELNKEIEEIVKREEKLRVEIAAIIKEIEAAEGEGSG